ncbi:MAG: hypothetical protein ACTIIH_10290 [Brevibacterium sp.]|uniref:hypothetical protein n=1 Tax=Brevibacterium TaxID=1696 RepID=UPI003F8C9073
MSNEELDFVKVEWRYECKGMFVTVPKRRGVFSEDYFIRQTMIDHAGYTNPRVFVTDRDRFNPRSFIIPFAYFDVLLEHYFIPEFGKCLLMKETKVTGKKCTESCQGADMSSKCTCACGRTNHGGAVDRWLFVIESVDR